MHWLRCCLALTAIPIAPACATSDGGPLPVPEPSYDAFVSTVYPVLLRDCGFPECHGRPERFFQVFGPGRARRSPATEPYAPATPDELAHGFGRARSMLLGEALLLRKPLAVAVGGAGHEGDDAWQQAVYPSRTAAGYLALEAWAQAAGVAP
jgi:hypothetical protein